MLYFNDPRLGIRAIEEDGSQDHLINEDWSPLSEDQVTTHIEMLLSNTTTSSEIAWRDSELTRSDFELNKVQDSDPKAKGSVSDWRNYRKALRSWPESLDFPNKDKRPLSPDMVKE